MSAKKFIFTSLDQIFKIIEINPELPDPAKWGQRDFVRSVPQRHTAGAFGGFEMPDASTYSETETYLRKYLIDPTSGVKIYYWMRA